jgi:hypothetical protein
MGYAPFPSIVRKKLGQNRMDAAEAEHATMSCPKAKRGHCG